MQAFDSWEGVTVGEADATTSKGRFFGGSKGKS